MKRIIKKLFNLVLLLVIFLIAYSLGNMVSDQVQINEVTNEFKSRAYEDYTFKTSRGDVTYYYYAVKRVHDYELQDARNVFSNQNKTLAGLPGDILATLESPFPFIPVIHQFISAFFGGHTAIVINSTQVLESTGLGANSALDFDTMLRSIMTNGFTEEKDLPTVAIQTNRWLEQVRNDSHPAYPFYGSTYRNTFYALRIKYTDTNQVNENLDALNDFASNRVGRALYNYLFVFDTEYKYYCSDLVSRAFEHVNGINDTDYDLNQDGFITSVQDIILSSDTYITIYHEKVGDDVYIYYLEDVE